MKKLHSVLLVILSVFWFLCAHADNYVIGVSLPLSGPLKDDGNNILNALKLCVEKINTSGELAGAQLVLHVVDDADIPAVAQIKARELIQDPKIIAVIGYLSNETAIACAPIYKEAHVTLFSPMATNPAFTQDNMWVFSGALSDVLQSIRIATYLKGITSFDDVLVIKTNTSDSKRQSEAFIKNSGRLGFKVQEILYEGVSGQLSKTIKTEQAKKYQAIVLFADEHASESIIIELRNAGINSPLYGNDKIIGLIQNNMSELNRNVRFITF